MRITHWLECPGDFPIANVKAKYHGKTEGDFEKCDHMSDLAVTIVQIEWSEKVVIKKLHFKEVFVFPVFLWPTSNLFRHQVLYMAWKLLKWGTFFW